MSDNRFNILIGVDMTDAEADIKKSITSISNGYPMKLKLIIDEKDKFFKQIRTIQQLFKNLGHIDVDFGVSGDKALDGMKNKLSNLSNTDLAQIGQELTDSMQKAEKQIDAVREASEKLMKVTDKKSKDGSLNLQTSKKGSKMLNETATTATSGDGNTLINGGQPITPPVQVRDFEALNNYIQKQTILLNSLSHATSKYGKDIGDVSGRLGELHGKLNSGDEGFHQEINNINKLVEKIHKYEQDMVKETRIKETQAKEQIKWANKLAEVERQGFANPASKGKMGRLIGDLSGDFRSLDQLHKKLSEVANQYAKIQGQEKGVSFARRVQGSLNSVKDKIGNGKLDSSYVSAEDQAKLNANLGEVQSAKTVVQLENALARANKQYDELLAKQARTKELEELDKKVRKIRVSVHDWNKELEQMKSGGFIKDAEFEKVRKSMKGLHAESETYTQDLKRIEQQISRLNSLKIKRQSVQETTDVKKINNNAKIESMRGIVPDSILNDKKAMNNMLDFSSSKKDLNLIEQEMKELEKLNNQIIAAGKEDAKIRQLIANYQQKTVESANSLNDALAQIIHSSNRQIQDEETKNRIELEAIAIQRQINSLKERGTQITYEEERAIRQQLLALSQVAQRTRDLEAAESKRQKQIQSYTDRVNSQGYRATRGFGDSSKLKNQLEADIEVIRQKVNGLNGKFGQDFANETKKIEEAMNSLNTKSAKFREQDKDKRGGMLNQLGTALKKVPVWLSAASLVYGITSQIKQGFQSLLNIDEAMINLKKVSEATNAQLDQFKNTASTMGKQLGVTATDVINATTAFQKLGFTLSQSTILGKNSILYANVGDMDIQTASDNIVATIKGFGVSVDEQGENIRKVVDIFNEVSNNFSITASGIGEALKRSSAVMKEAGNSIGETVGLVASANAVIQNPEKVGNGLKTIAMRLRGLSDEGEDVERLVPQLQGVFDRINKEYGIMGDNALKLMEQDGTTFKSTYEIFEQVSKVWDKLSDIERANLVDLMGGKNQGVIASAIISNWKDAANAADTAANSSGSAVKEFDAYMDGFGYRIGQLTNSIEKFWNQFLDSASVKTAISMIQGLVDVITSIQGSVGSTPMFSALIAGIAYLGSKGVRDSIKGIKKIEESVHSLNAETEKVGDTTKTASGGIDSMGESATRGSKAMTILGNATKVAMRAFAFTAVIAGISYLLQLLMKWKNREKEARKERIKGLEDEITVLEENKKKYSEVFDDSGDDGKNKLLDRFTSLQESTHRTNEEQQEYLTTLQKVKTELPQLISYYNDHGEAVLKSANAIEKLREAEEAELLQKNKALLNEKLDDTSFKSINKLIDKTHDLENQKAANEATAKMLDAAESMIKDGTVSFESTGEEYLKSVDAFKMKLAGIYQELPSDVQNYTGRNMMMIQSLYPSSADDKEFNQAIEAWRKKVKYEGDEIGKSLQKTALDVSANSEEVNNMIDMAFSNLTNERNIKADNNTFKFIDDLRLAMKKDITKFGEEAEVAIKEIPNYVDDALSVISDSGYSIDEIITIDPETSRDTEDKIGNIIAYVKNLNDQKYDGLIEQLDKLRDAHEQAYLEMKNNPIKPFNIQAEVLDPLNQTIDDLSDLDSAYKTLRDGQELSISTTVDLIDKYPELVKNMKIENGTIKLTKDSIKDLAKAREEEFKKNLQEKISAREQSLATAKQELADNLDRAKSLRDLANTRAKLMSINDAKKVTDSVDGTFMNPKPKIDPNDPSTFPKLWDVLPSAEQLKNNLQYKQAKEVLDAAKDANKADDSVKQAQKVVDDINEQIAEMEKLKNLKIADNLGDIGGTDDKQKDIQDGYYVVNQYQKAIDNLSRSIEHQQSVQAENTTWSNKYKAALNEEIYLTNRKKSAIDGEIKSLKDQIATSKIKQTGLITVSKDQDNKTARLKAAELQQKIDEAQSRLLQLQGDAEDTAARIQELRMEQIKSVLSGYEANKEALTDDIAYQEYAMGLYSESSKSYRDHAAEKLKLTKEQMNQDKLSLAYLEKEKASSKNLTASQIEDLNEQIREKRKAVYEMAQTVDELETLIAESGLNEELNRMASETKKYGNMIRDIEDSMKYDLDDEKDYGKKINYLRQILSLEEGQKLDAEDNIAFLKKQLVVYKDNKEMVEKISDEIESWEDSLHDANNAIKDTNADIKQVYEDFAEKYVDLYKEQLELMRQADEDYYKDQIEIQNKAHDARMKQLDKESKALQDAYDKQMKLIERTEAAHDYGNDLDKAQNEVADIKKQIDLLSMDDSYEAKAKKANLLKQLSEKEADLAEMKHDREVDLRKNDLQDTLDTENDKLDKRKQAEDEATQAVLDALQQQADAREKYWQNELQNEKKFAELRQQVLNGNFDAMLKNISTWKDDVGGEMGALGQVVEDNFTKKIQDAIDAITQLKGMKVGSLSSSLNENPINNQNGDAPVQAGVPKNNVLTEKDKKDSVINQMIENSKAYSNLSPNDPELKDKRKKLHDENVKLGASIGAVYKNGSWFEKDGKTPLYQFKSGGYTGDWGDDEGKLAVLHKKELVLNADQTKNILDTAKIVERFKSFLPTLMNLAPSVGETTNNSTGTVEHNEYNIQVSINGNAADKNIADTVADQIVNKIKRTKGGRF